MFKFIHAADIHLDSPLIGLERYEGAPVEQIRGATRQALENLVRLAIDERAAFLLIAGDLYDGNWRDYNTGLFLVKEMTKLREAGVRVFIIAGNHDAESNLTRNLSNFPDNVKRFSTRTAQTEILDDLGVAVHGQGFPRRVVTEDMSAGYPVAERGCFNIGLLHTCADGREGHEPYAPCSLPGLLAKDYQYWALGHIHRREILSEKPYILFPGNTQGRHIRETGPKGCTMVTVESGDVTSLEHRDLDVLRWAALSIDASDAKDGDDIVELVRPAIRREMQTCDGRLLAARLKVVGSCKAHEELSADPAKWINELRAMATDEGGGDVWLEKVQLNTGAQIDLEEAQKRQDPVGDLLRFVQELGNEEGLGSLTAELEELREKLPVELRQGAMSLNLDKPETLREVLEDVQQLLVPLLLSKGGPL
jgi:DNA repair protein SbcD/Mre11